MKGRPAFWCNSLSKQAERSSGLLFCDKDFRDICLSTLRPNQAGSGVRGNNEPLYIGGHHVRPSDQAEQKSSAEQRR